MPTYDARTVTLHGGGFHMLSRRRPGHRSAVLLLAALSFTPMTAGSGPHKAPIVDPSLATLVAARPVRVILELRLDERHEARRAEAIARAQDRVLARLSPSHASLGRRYDSVPMLALEIDAVGLRELEAMGDIVVRVLTDEPRRTQP